MQLRVYLTGRVGLEANGDLVIQERHFRGRQDRVAFAYLVCERGRPVTRQELAAAVWRDELPPAWPAGLSAIVSRLRSLLEREQLTKLPATISRGFGQYRLFLRSDTWVDLEAAAAAVDAAEARVRGNEPRAAFGPATVAATIARRPLLSGEDGGWVALERERLRRIRLRALDCLAQVWLIAGEPTYAIEAAAEALAIEPMREGTHRLLMRAHASVGSPAEALAVYHRLRERLSNEQGINPSAETEALYLELLG